MIFKTVNTDAKNLIEQFGLLNKSFQDIKKDFTNGLGVKNSLFQSSISKTDYQSLQKFNSAINVTNDGLTKSQRITKAWNENMTGCSMVAKRMGNDLVTGKKKISDVSSAMNTATASTKAFEIAMNVFANVGFMLAITIITKVVSELVQAQSQAVEMAKEATETYNDEINSITDYKTKLSELHEELESGNLSYEETKTKRTELMSIQDELIEKFGTEKGAIESVTEAVNGQVDALDGLNEKAYRDWVTKADEQTFWNKLLPGGKSGLDQAIDYMETEKTVSFFDMSNANDITQDKYQAPITDEIRTIQEEIDKTIQSKYNLEKEFATFKLTGTPDEIKSQLELIKQDYLDLSKEAFLENGISSEYWEAYRSEAINSINEVINKFDDGLEKHQETYQTYIEGMIKYDSEYSDEYATILQKRAALESAENSGNADDIQKARQEFMDAINNGIQASGSDENIKKYFESLYPELQAKFTSWNFEVAINANTNGLTDEAKEIGEQYSATDLLDMVNTEGTQEGEESFNKLIDKAIEYGVCTDKSAEEVQKLIDLLVELGIVQGNVQGSTSNETDISFDATFNSSEFASTAKELFNLAKSGEITASVLESTEEYKTLLDETGVSAEVAKDKITNMLSTTEKLSAASNGLENLSKAYEEFKDKDIGFVTASTLESLPDVFKSLPEYDLFSQIVSDPTSGTEKIQQAFDDIVKQYLISQNTFSGLINASESDINSYIANLKKMGIANAEEVVQEVQTIFSQEKQLINQAENEIYNAHLNYLLGKGNADLQYLEDAASKNGQLANTLGSAYQSDYNNWCSKIGMLGGNAVIKVSDDKKPWRVIKWLKGYTTSGEAHAQIGILNGTDVYKRYAKGTTHARKGLHLVSEDQYGDELIIQKDGNAVIAKGEQLYSFEGGETVINASETRKILSNMDNLTPVDTMKFAGINGEIVHFKPDELWQRIQNVMPGYSNMVQPMLQMKRYHAVTPMSPIEQHNQFNISLPNIHDGDKALKLMKDLERLSLDALQYSSKR